MKSTIFHLLAIMGLTVSVVVSDRCPIRVMVVGSVNADTFLSVSKLPIEGENLTTLPGASSIELDVPGGKGCTQAVACSKLLHDKCVSFWAQFGNDEHVAEKLQQCLIDNNVNLSACGVSDKVPCGRGFVFRIPSTGQVSAVVAGGANSQIGWEKDLLKQNTEEYTSLLEQQDAIMLQREIPQAVNEMIVSDCQNIQPEKRPLVFLDMGGEDAPLSPKLLKLCDFIIPNQSEFSRMLKHFGKNTTNLDDDYNDNTNTQQLISCARYLQKHHSAKNILVTLGSQGCIFIPCDENRVAISLPACALPDGCEVVDETGAGDCFRAAFVVALCEKTKSIKQCLEFASAAGAISVTRKGAVPSCPSREEVEMLYNSSYPDDKDHLEVNHSAAEENRNRKAPSVIHASEETVELTTSIRGGLEESAGESDDGWTSDMECPLLFGSRLNSMKDRPELWDGPQNVKGWVKRQGQIKGLGCVDFNYPQHFMHGTTGELFWKNIQEAKRALEESGLKAGAVCLRYPHNEFQQGAMTHFDPHVRQRAIDLTKKAAEVAKELDCREVVVWSAYDGYDYPFQVDYEDKWNSIVSAFQECCDAHPDILFSLEYKPTDENTRFFSVPSTGATIALVHQIDRPNMGITLDVGHMLMSGENPGQSISMVHTVCGPGKLFGIQLNDGYTRLAAEDGLMFGSVHPMNALEIMYYLQQTKFSGHLYFDTFPQRTDPVKEAEYNIRRVKEFWIAAKRLNHLQIKRNAMLTHDALAALELADDALAFARSHRHRL